MNAQKTLNRLEEIGEKIKELSAERSALLNDFIQSENGTFEHRVMVEGKEKWFRVYPSEGHFVYNRVLDFGTRVKAQNPAPVLD